MKYSIGLIVGSNVADKTSATKLAIQINDCFSGQWSLTFVESINGTENNGIWKSYFNTEIDINDPIKLFFTVVSEFNKHFEFSHVAGPKQPLKGKPSFGVIATNKAVQSFKDGLESVQIFVNPCL